VCVLLVFFAGSVLLVPRVGTKICNFLDGMSKALATLKVFYFTLF